MTQEISYFIFSEENMVGVLHTDTLQVCRYTS